jgi:hypothetical protein
LTCETNEGTRTIGDAFLAALCRLALRGLDADGEGWDRADEFEDLTEQHRLARVAAEARAERLEGALEKAEMWKVAALRLVNLPIITTSAPFQEDKLVCRACNAVSVAKWGLDSLDHAPDCAVRCVAEALRKEGGDG